MNYQLLIYFKLLSKAIVTSDIASPIPALLLQLIFIKPSY